MGDAPVRGFSVTTQCRSIEEFVETYKALTDGESIVVDTVEPCALGSECAFAILLENHRPVLAGTGVVLESFGDVNNRFERQGVRVGITRLGVDSERVFAALTAARTGGRTATLRRRIRTVTIPSRDEPLPRGSRPTLPFAMREPHERPPSAPHFVCAEGSNELFRREQRTPGSSLVLPANPLTDVSDESLEGLIDCRLFEATSASLVEPTQGTGGVPIPVDVESTVPEPAPVVSHRQAWRSLPSQSDRFAMRMTQLPTWVWGATLVVAIVLGAGVGGGIALLVKRLAAPSATATAPVLDTSATLEPALVVRVTTWVEAPPPPPPKAAPTHIHAVLVQTAPIAARVIVDGRPFGTTPTYIKVPGFEPVTLEIQRPGYEPATRTLTSKRKYERVFVRLKRQHAARR